jgi:hypothetical protein
MAFIRPRSVLSTIVIAVALLNATPAKTVTFTVGAGTACSHGTIQAAIDAAAANGADTLDTVRIAPIGSVGQALVITSQRLRLHGGYADCAPASLPSDVPTLIDGNGNGGLPVLRISNPGAVRRTVSIQNLEIMRGIVPSGDGGGIHASGNMQLEMQGILIRDNRAARGGGIYARGDAADRNMEITLYGYGAPPRFSKIEANQADLGGGVYVDAHAQLRLELAQISNNFAIDGGGVFFATDSSGQFFGNVTTEPHGIFGNSASRDGGGLYVSGRANLYYSSFLTDAVFTIQDNIAGRDGGGIYASGAGAFLYLGGVLRGNRAGTQSTGRGGGAFVAAGANMIFRGADAFEPNPIACPSSADCALISNNIAGSPTLPGQGGGLFAAAGGRISTQIAAFRDNSASEGAAAMASGAGSSLNIASTLLTRNASAGSSAGAVLAATDTAELRILSSTLSGNPSNNSLLARSNSRVDVVASILYDFQPVIVTTGGSSNTLSTLCVFAHENFDPGGDVRVSDPGFSNATGGDYSLRLDSAAVDACNGVDAFPRDSRNQPRGVDLLEVIDVDGVFDAGAIERQRPDAVFANGFEN